MNVNDYIGYKLSQASIYLKKAKRILDEIELLNYKIECDFDSIDNFCTYHAVVLKKVNNENGFKDHN